MTHIILFFCCILTGFLLGRHLHKQAMRTNGFFCDLARYVADLKLNIVGKQQEMSSFNTVFAANCTPAFSEALLIGKLPSLSKQQKQRIRQFFADLDCPSSQQLLQNLDFFSNQLQADLYESRNKLQKSSIYAKLGMLLGAMLGILFL